MFVDACVEKWVVAERVTQELANILPRPPALRVFDAGIGDGTVLSRVMRSMHQHFETLPFYVVGKKITSEDFGLTLEKFQESFNENPPTPLILTTFCYSKPRFPYPTPPPA